MTSLPSFIADMPLLPTRAATFAGSDAAGAGTGGGLADFAGLLDAAAAAVPVTGTSPVPWPTEGAAGSAGPMPVAIAQTEEAVAPGPFVLPLTRAAAGQPAQGLFLPQTSGDPVSGPASAPAPATVLVAGAGNFLPRQGAPLPPQLPPPLTPSPELAVTVFEEVSEAPPPAPRAPASAAPLAVLAPDHNPDPRALPLTAEPATAQPRDAGDGAEAPATQPDPASAQAGGDAAAPLADALPPVMVVPAAPPPSSPAAPQQSEDTGEGGRTDTPEHTVIQAPVAGLPAIAPQPAIAAQPATPPASVALPAAALSARLPSGGRSEIAPSPARSALPQTRTTSAPTPTAAPALPEGMAHFATDPATIAESAETGGAAPAASWASFAPAAPAAGPAAAPTLAADPAADPAPPAPTLAANPAAPGTRGEAAIDQVGALREALRSARPAMTLQHAEFGTVSLRLEAAAPDQWRAVLASRDPGFVPAIQAALAERALAPAAAAADTASGGHHGASQNGAGDQRYGASPNGGQGGSQPYLGQSGGRDGEAAPDHRRPSTAAALAARGTGEAEDPASRSGTAGGLFA